MKLKKIISLGVIFSMTFSSIACTTMKPISLTDPANFAQIKAGDVIHYQTVSGQTEQLKITSVNDEMIRGTSQGQEKSIMVTDIRYIEKKEISAGKTSLLVLGILGFLGIIAAVISNNVDFRPSPDFLRNY